MTSSFEHIDHVYLIGIGGIGMSALARYFHHEGKSVSGYDRTSSRITEMLEKEGIHVTTKNEVETIPSGIRSADPGKVLIIYTAAIRNAHTQLDWLKSQGHQPVKRAQVLGAISRDYKLIAVGGTHGKTTTSCLIAYLLSRSDIPFIAILGGLSADLGSNFYVNGNNPGIMVTEADEFDGSFLHLHPYVTVLTSTDADHLDFYQSESRIKEAFQKFAESTQEKGALYYQANTGIHTGDVNATAQSYGIETGDIQAKNLTISDAFYFTYSNGSQQLTDLHLGVPGIHNVENAVAAISAVEQVGMDTDRITESLPLFKGVQRRFEYIIRRDDLVYIDDYAHHPTELKATIQSVRKLYPGKKITGIFQPHLYSRTKDFAREFAECLSELDHAILMPIYPAREAPIPGVETQMIMDLMNLPDRQLMEPNEIMEEMRKNRPQVLLTLGAGDIDRIVEPLKQILE